MMGMDEPTKPEFASPFSYIHFANKVKSNRRYVWAKEVDAFLETVLQTVANRITDISEGTTLYRAQHGVREEAIKDEDGDEIGFRFFGHKKQRMKPRSDKASEGRVNPTGIPVLYLASQIKTAISEIRPWVGSQVSVARMDIRRDLKLVDLSERLIRK